jgi:hypothetical protein
MKLSSSSSSAVSLLLLAWLNSQNAAYSQFIPGDLCRCQADDENFYSERRRRRHLTEQDEEYEEYEQAEQSSILQTLRSLQTLDPVTGLYVVDGIFVLPDSDPKCSTSVPFRTGGGASSLTGTGATTIYSAPKYHGDSPDPDPTDVFGKRRNLMSAAVDESDMERKEEVNVWETETHQQRTLQYLQAKYHGQTQPGEPPQTSQSPPQTSQSPPQTSQTSPEISARGSRPYGATAYVSRPDYGKGK